MCQTKSHGHGGHDHHRHGGATCAGPPGHRTGAAGPSRRQALRRLGAAGLAFAAGGSPWALPFRTLADAGHPRANGPASTRLFDLKQVAEGIYAAIAKPAVMLNCNAAVVVNRD